MGSRTILHLDMDTYFVSVERLSFPWLEGRPVVVGGRSLRSVVASCSYEARERGVHAGMPMVQALRLSPDAVLVSGSHGSYSSYTRRILKVMLSFSPMVEPVSIDEAFMEITGVPTRSTPTEFASDLQRAIHDATGLWGSVGVAGNRFLAKMASKRAKPRGVLTLGPDDITDFPVGSIWGVGPKTQRRFLSLGIERVGDLRRFTRHQLRALMGKHGEGLYYLCRGLDDSPVIPGDFSDQPLSISNEHTFEADVSAPEDYLPILSHLCQKVARRTRDAGLAGSTVTLKYRLSNLQRRTRARVLPAPTDIDRFIYAAARSLALDAVRERIRLIGVCLSSLVPASGCQMELFGGGGDAVTGTVDGIRRKYGEKAITGCRTLARGHVPVSRAK
jgi:DNA polymerase IV